MRYIEFSKVNNYYENLVFEEIVTKWADSANDLDNDALEDIACLALNQLPSRYVRYNVDTTFYLSSKEQQEMRQAVSEAVERAVQYVRDNPR